MTPKYFVWIKNFHGEAEAQLWSEDIYVGGKPAPFIFKHKLATDEKNLTLGILAKVYENEKTAI